MLCGCETWKISIEQKRIKVFEMWCYRGILKMCWIQTMTIEEVLNKITEGRSLWK